MSFVLTDTHTHFYYERDAGRRAGMMRRCLENNISRLFLPNVDLESVPMVFDLVDEYPEYCFPMLGLHPCDVNENWAEELAQIRTFFTHKKIWAIGEIGIDLYWDKTTLARQQDAFHAQIAWAKEEDLPIVIHCRDAFDEVFEVLEQERDARLRGILHCFTGNTLQAEKLIAMNFHLGIGGVVTYKNSGLDHVVAGIDLAHIVLETDSPYLAPVPFRGKRNESAYLIHIAQKIADLKGISVEDVADITTKNAKNVFGT
ncbi:MAG: TatD family hydrolase [Mucilaginibacter polytrichastri]|nr:TatD family hydrolase [Mucilaginibacter polytrichastri]